MRFMLFMIAVFVAFSSSISAQQRARTLPKPTPTPVVQTTAPPPAPFGNADVVRLVQAGLPEAVILTKIKTEPVARFDTSTDALVELSAAKVPSAIIGAMLERMDSTSQRQDTAPPSPVHPAANKIPATSAEEKKVGDPSLPEEAGVYVFSSGKLVDAQVETLQQKTSGLFKAVATGGLMGAEVDGYVTGVTSQRVVTKETTLVMKMTEGLKPEEYNLIVFTLKKDRREVKLAKAGLLSYKMGVGAAAVSLTWEKIGLRTYRAKLEHLQPGQYAILPPGEKPNRVYSFALK